ncbi:MAG: hypothetical protein WC455_13835 [Dehalococcoidia bacterium]|jgi:hypothetical protein
MKVSDITRYKASDLDRLDGSRFYIPGDHIVILASDFDAYAEAAEQRNATLEDSLRIRSSDLFSDKHREAMVEKYIEVYIDTIRKQSSQLAKQSSIIEGLSGALEDVETQFACYESSGKRLSACSVYLDITKVRAAIAASKEVEG